ncbi:MAG: molybdopterin-dependent oxidoreductase [Spirochaetaceae bacterium]|nr:MAG: molybdopterin-dependent oxidoreductase [Spirochaetaceae bacterium]
MADRPSEQVVVDGHCGICGSACAVRIHLKDGKIQRLTPRTGHPAGFTCRRITRVHDIVYSPQRLLYPQRGSGPRAKRRLERIGWDQALDHTAKELKHIADRYGPEAVCIYTGRGTFEEPLWEMLSPADVRESSAWNLLFPFGSPNTTGAGSNCYAAQGVIAPALNSGVWKIDTYADVENAELVVVWGTNPANGSPPRHMAGIQKARSKGARVLVIDPRRSETASISDARWLALRPGTDGALALAMIREIIQENLYDRAFIDNWTVGFKDLKDYVSGFTAEEAERITAVPAEQIRSTAREIARAGNACFLYDTGLEYATSGLQNTRAVLILEAITGNYDVPGGTVICTPPFGFIVNRSRRIAPPEGKPAIGSDLYPLYTLYRREAQAMELPRAILEAKPYPIKALLIVGASILTAYPNPDLWRRAFEKLEFLLVADRVPTEEILYADIVLPACTVFEYGGYVVQGHRVAVRQAVIEPLGESRSDWDIAIALANRLGYGHLYPRDVDEMVKWAFEGTGLDLEELRRHPEGVDLALAPMEYRKWEKGHLRADGQPGFPTPSGKYEIASSILKSYGYDALPVFTPPAEGPLGSPELLDRYPLIFNSGARNKVFFNSQHHHVPSLVERCPTPLVWIHPHDAAARGIVEGDRVVVSTPRGSVAYTAHVTEDILPGAIEADAHGGGVFAAPAWRDCNANELTDFENRDPLTGFPVYKSLLCEVRKAEEPG